MMQSEIANGFKLAAIDLDGTLLGSDHQMSAANERGRRRKVIRWWGFCAGAGASC
jgi:hypothetical protein